MAVIVEVRVADCVLVQVDIAVLVGVIVADIVGYDIVGYTNGVLVIVGDGLYT